MSELVKNASVLSGLDFGTRPLLVRLEGKLFFFSLFFVPFRLPPSFPDLFLYIRPCRTSSNLSTIVRPTPDLSPYILSPDQKWCKTANKTIRFIDETENVAALYATYTSSDEDEPAGPRTLEYSTPASIIHLALSQEPTLASLDPVLDREPTPSQLSFYLTTPRLPLKSAHEADLLQHFVTHLAPAFDFGDQYQTFATVVPRQAAICPPLFNALLALAELHQKHTGHALPGHPSIAPGMLSYHKQGIGRLPSLLHTLATADDDNLVAAVLIFQHCAVVEGYECPNSPAQEARKSDDMGLVWSRLLAVRLFDETHRHPVFWALVREEVYLAIMYQRPPSPFRHSSPDLVDIHAGGLAPADDYTWANRMLWHLLVVLQYCFDDDQDSAVSVQLVNYAEAWMQARPASFSPIFVQEKSSDLEEGGSRSMFPEIVLLNDSVVLGLQCYHLVRLLLIAHDPTMPRVGVRQRAAARSVDEALRSDAGIICGIADSIGGTNPAHLFACMAIALAGDRFDGEAELDILLDVLKRTESKFGWPTRPACVLNTPRLPSSP